MVIFDKSNEKYEHQDKPDLLKVAMIKKREDSSDASGPKIHEVEMNHHKNSKPAFVSYVKVIPLRS